MEEQTFLMRSSPPTSNGDAPRRLSPFGDNPVLSTSYTRLLFANSPIALPIFKLSALHFRQAPGPEWARRRQFYLRRLLPETISTCISLLYGRFFCHVIRDIPLRRYGGFERRFFYLYNFGTDVGTDLVLFLPHGRIR